MLIILYDNVLCLYWYSEIIRTLILKQIWLEWYTVTLGLN